MMPKYVWIAEVTETPDSMSNDQLIDLIYSWGISEESLNSRGLEQDFKRYEKSEAPKFMAVLAELRNRLKSST